MITANSEFGYQQSFSCPTSPPSDFNNYYNLGPPNQTDPISTPGTGLMAIDVLPDNEGGNPSRKKSHLIINKQLDPLQTCNKLPFLSYGAQSDWGNGHGVITLLRQSGAPTVLSFAATLFDIYNPSDTLRFNSGFVIIEAQWGGKKRWAYISILNRNNNNVDAVSTPQQHFNWNILQGVWFPGADIAFKNASTLDSECPSRVSGWTQLGVAADGRTLHPTSMIDPTITYNNTPNPGTTTARYIYTVDLLKLFTCLSPDFTNLTPTGGNIPITGIHFALEQSHDYTDNNGYLLNPPYVNYTWIAIDSVTLQ